MSDAERWERLATEFATAVEEFARLQNAPNAERLRTLRLQTVAELLEVTGPIGAARAAALGQILNACRQSGVRQFSRTPAEQARLTHCLERAAGNEEAPRIAALLLVSHAFELQRVPPIASLPPETRPLWLKLLLEPPGAVEHPGDCERFVEYLRLLCSRFQEYLDSVTSVPTDIAEGFLSQPFVGHAYFTELNLRDIMRAKAEISERMLESCGFVLDQLRNMRPLRERPRIGFFSAHLSGSTDTVFLAAHLERMDRRRYEIRLYSCEAPEGPIGALCKATAEKYTLLPKDTDEAVAFLRREDLDLAVFSCNVTIYAHKIAQIAAHRVARMQLTNGSCPVSTGLRNMDFLVQGEANETEESQAQYTERLLRISGGADCYPFQYLIGGEVAQPVSRTAVGVPEDAVIYFSAANYYKLIPELTRTWMTILAQVPGSYLLLMPFNPNWSSNYAWQPLVERLVRQAQEAGVSPQRVRMHGAVPKIVQLHSLMAVADVCLDSFPYSGACSYFDALTVGLPVVTRRGRVNRSRHGSAILEQEGLADWVAEDEQGYIRRAVELGRDSQKRREDRERLARARQAGLKLLDTADYAAKLSPMFGEILGDWNRHVAALQALSGAELAERIGQLVRGVAAKRTSFSARYLLQQVVVPYLIEGSRRLIHVGSPATGATGSARAALRSFLIQGWQAVFFDPDPSVSELAMRYDGQVRVETNTALRGLQSPGPLVTTLSLAPYIRRKRLFDLDFVHVSPGSAAFTVLRSLDFAEATPRLMMVEFDERFPRQDCSALEGELQHMRDAGYRACVVCGAIGVDAVPQDGARERLFGSILFFRADDRHFLPSLADWLSRVA